MKVKFLYDELFQVAPNGLLPNVKLVEALKILFNSGAHLCYSKRRRQIILVSPIKIHLNLYVLASVSKAFHSEFVYVMI